MLHLGCGELGERWAHRHLCRVFGVVRDHLLERRDHHILADSRACRVKGFLVPVGVCTAPLLVEPVDRSGIDVGGDAASLGDRQVGYL
jgi:hypothetical protein